MPSTPAPTALSDFLKVAKARAQLILPPPAERTEADEAVRDAMRERCRELLGCTVGGWPTDALFQLRKILEIAVHLRLASANEWLLLQEIFEAVGPLPRCRPPSDAEAWGEALDTAANALNHNWHRKNLLPGSREEAVARALSALKRKGFPNTLDGYGARLTGPAYRKLCARIEDKIERVGGLRAANMMLEVMERSLRIEDGSLLHARMPVMVTNRVPRPGTPWHYIYNLCLKHFLSPPRVTNVKPVLTAMEELACALAASINVEPYSSYENMHLSGYFFAGTVHELIIYDELFGFPQWQPQASTLVLPLWLDALTEAGCTMPNFTREQWQTGAMALTSCSAAARIDLVESARLASRTLPLVDATAMLELLSAPASQVNSAYCTPSDTAHRSGSWYPVIRGDAGTYYTQPRAVLTRAFCERLYALMRENPVTDLENKMGKALELLTIKVLTHFGIVPTITNGTYVVGLGSQLLEVDLVVETDDRIFFIECTKKPLTTAARGGSTIASLRDLEGSFLKLIQQLARHEAELRTTGILRFADGRRLELRGRHIEKVGINLFDHGSIQSRDFTIAMIERLAGASMASEAPEAQETVRAVNKRLNRLSESVARIVEARRDIGDRALFHFAMSTWWLSIDQLVYLLLKGGGDLWTSIRDIRHMTTRSGDLVYEIKRSHNLNELGRAMVDASQQMNSRAMI